ncbi:hypothetical protein CCMA1212_010560 [Trichoderma ghanense]|uniref:Uncharacterized protein n=1 Tax=Trichoderma ghanense TaxID=65468 RepID=A0ABY2GPA9_9HYPO
MAPNAIEAAAPIAPASVTEFEFVVGDRPDQLKAGSNSKLRSHLSKRGWQVYLLQHNSAAGSSSSSTPADEASQQREDRSRRKKRKRLQHTITWDVRGPDDPQFPGTATPTNNNSLIQGAGGFGAVQPLAIEYQLGGGRVDPFRSYPTPWRSYIPHLVDHYIVHMAVDIPELDEPGRKGLLRSRWFRLATTEISTFQVVLLLSAGNYVSVKGGIAAEVGFNMDQLRIDALKSIGMAMDLPNNATDSIIGAVAKMASFEAMHGDLDCFQLHMNAARRLVNMRGGLHNLGLGGLLRRMLIWIDLNGGHLMNTERWFPGQTFAGSEEEVEVEPNPERFIAM